MKSENALVSVFACKERILGGDRVVDVATRFSFALDAVRGISDRKEVEIDSRRTICPFHCQSSYGSFRR